jgi:hypothetical protein
MEDKRFDLTPRQILTHLLEIEKKASREEFRIYIPTEVIDAIVPDDKLKKEAQRMLEFVGLYDYDIDVSYAQTAYGTGGDVKNNGIEKSVNIHVSEIYRTDREASVAVLAHEICHKVLFVKGLYSPTIIMNEVYAELATIYYGFGEIVLKGYQAKDHCLGYLKSDTYKKVNLLVCVVCGNIKSEVLNLKDIDPLADEAIEVWEKYDDKRTLLINCFKNAESQIAEFYRNIRLLEQILEELKKEIKGEFERIDKMYFKDFINIGYSRIDAFLFIYDNYSSRELLNKRFTQLNESVSKSIFNLLSIYQEQGYLELKYNYTCPVCGTTRENKLNSKGISIRKCPNPECGKYITFNTDEWNATVFQRRAIQKEKEEKEAFNNRVEEYTERIKKEARDTILEVKKTTNDKVNSIRSETTKEIEEIRRNEQQRCKDEIRNKIPSYLRWLVAKYIQ